MCSGCHFHWTFPIEVNMETIVTAWCATVNNARPHEEKLECEAVSPNFHEWTVRWRHGSALWIMPCSAGHILNCRIPHKGSFQWQMCHLSQCGQTEMWCSGQRIIPISRRSWNIIHRMWWYGRVWHQIIWLDLAFSMDWWMRHLIQQCWRCGSYLI